MSSEKNLLQWLTYIESFHPEEIELGLERIRIVAEKLSLLPFNFPVILVGGTNGKGSCVAMLESLALQSNPNVCCYTSPHLVDFNERIRINGKNVDVQQLVDAFEQIESMRDQTPLTFFEFTTLAALLIFSKNKPDLVVLEVGLGGRKDATNIVEPDVSIITTVDIDHTQWLGNDIKQIAYEKAGIMRNDKHALIGDKATYDLLVDVAANFHKEMSLIDIKNCNIAGICQQSAINHYNLHAQNIALAVESYSLLFKISLTEEYIASALKNIQFAGRFDLISINPDILVDVAHNVQAVGRLKAQLAAFKKEKNIRLTYAVCGMMKDKAINEVISIIDGEIDEWLFVDLDTPRASSADSIRQAYLKSGLQKNVETYPDVQSALTIATAKMNTNDLLLVFGSFITVGEAVKICKGHEPIS